LFFVCEKFCFIKISLVYAEGIQVAMKMVLITFGGHFNLHYRIYIYIQSFSRRFYPKRLD